MTKSSINGLVVIMTIILMSCQTGHDAYRANQFQKFTLTFQGPKHSETDDINPFLNYRLWVTFKHPDTTLTLRGFFAADGSAAQTGSDQGNLWKVRFRPPLPGEWTYHTSFRQGEAIAVSDDKDAGSGVFFDGEEGLIQVEPASGDEPGFTGKGKLVYTNHHYPRFSGDGSYFLKGGADSPENFLAYEDFDDTYKIVKEEKRSGEAEVRPQLHRYEPHVKDWKQGDPTWQQGKGKAMIGALNYLASKGMNSVYMLTMNIGGDGKDVWPYIDHESLTRFDCSKLDQWEIVFDHMDSLGIQQHFVTQETENELLLDSGYTRLNRKLYYLELIARFAHHPAVVWNMGEENGYAHWTPTYQTTAQQKEMIGFMDTRDPYNSLIVLHTHSNNRDRDSTLNQLVGFKALDGPSVQYYAHSGEAGEPSSAHREILEWYRKSEKAGHPWLVYFDELGPASRGIDPDRREDNNQDSIRAAVLWGALMAGSAGVEWYFGYKNPHNDLNCEDWRSRDNVWDFTRHALTFFTEHAPAWEFEPVENEIISSAALRCYLMKSQGNRWAGYADNFEDTRLKLPEGNYEIRWFNPRQGGELIKSEWNSSDQAGLQPPDDPKKDWAFIVVPEK